MVRNSDPWNETPITLPVASFTLLLDAWVVLVRLQVLSVGKENLVANFRVWGFTVVSFIVYLPGHWSWILTTEMFTWISYPFTYVHMTKARPWWKGPKNPAEGLTCTSFHARISIPLVPSVFLAPFVCVLCIRFTDLKWLVGHCEPRIIFTSQS